MIAQHDQAGEYTYTRFVAWTVSSDSCDSESDNDSAVFVTVNFVAVKIKQILNQCNHQLGHNKAKSEVETSQNPVNIYVVTVTLTVNVNVTVTVTPATV